MTRQEMFERAVRGLAGQGWKQAISGGTGFDSSCVYLTEDGRRCAWGHVDPVGTSTHFGTVRQLHDARIGLAATLSESDLKFALALQFAHDDAEHSDLHENMWRFGVQHDLAWPSDVPRFGGEV